MQGIDLAEVYAQFGPGWGVIVVFLVTLPAIIVPILNRERKKPKDPLAEIQASTVSMAKRIDELVRNQAADRDAIDKEMKEHDRRIMRLEAKDEAAREAYRARIDQTIPPRR